MYEIVDGGEVQIRKVASRRFIKENDLVIIAVEITTEKPLTNVAFLMDFKNGEIVKASDRDKELEFETIEDTTLVRLPEINSVYDFGVFCRISASGEEAGGKLTSDLVSVEHSAVPFAVVKNLSETIESLVNFKPKNDEDKILFLEKKILALEMLLDFSLIGEEEYKISRETYEKELEKMRINFLEDVKIVAKPVINIEEIAEHVKHPKRLESKFEDPHVRIRELLGTKQGQGILLARKRKIERYLMELKKLYDQKEYSEEKYIALRDEALSEMAEVEKELHKLNSENF